MKTKQSSLFDVLVVLSAGATLLTGCTDATPGAQAPAQATEIAPAGGSAGGPAAPVSPAASPSPMPATAASTPSAVPTVPATTPAPAAATSGAKAMPPKRKDSKRVADKSTQGCCGAGTCSPC